MDSDPDEILDRSLLIRRVTWWGRHAATMRICSNGIEHEMFRGSYRACDCFLDALRPVLGAAMVAMKERTDQCLALELAVIDSIELHKPGLCVFRLAKIENARQVVSMLANLVHGSPKKFSEILFLVMPPDVGVESLGEDEMAQVGWVRSE